MDNIITVQEAIRTLKMEMLGDSEQMKWAKQIAIEALEKQIPKKQEQEYDCKNCIHDEICPVWDDYNDEPCKDGYRGFCNNYNKFKQSCFKKYGVYNPGVLGAYSSKSAELYIRNYIIFQNLF